LRLIRLSLISINQIRLVNSIAYILFMSKTNVNQKLNWKCTNRFYYQILVYIVLVYDCPYSVPYTYIHTTHALSTKVAKISQIFIRNSCILLKWLSYDKYCRHDRSGCCWSFSRLLRCPWKMKGEVLFYCSVSDTTRDERFSYDYK
jgi:hypothetical protein